MFCSFIVPILPVAMFTALAVLSLAAFACAERIVITVRGNTTNDVTTVFEPREVRAVQGDVVVFNCMSFLPVNYPNQGQT